jgi:hypothetical protein
MTVLGLLMLVGGAAAGYGAAQALFTRDPLSPEMPPRVREPLERAQLRLRRMRARTMVALDEAERGRREATAELEADYHRRVRRQG